jgi:E1A/CREB-binding protein
MYKRYSRNGCPSEFPVHTKCVGIFQSINGVDVLLFAMYVYEYGDDCPAPNRRRVYISYLDSVQYFHPKEYRSIVYQSIIVEYLRFVKERGFHTAHIWSCSPAPGDEYVFYSHPSHQKVPGEDMLRNWYYKTLDKAKAEGIVVETVDLYDEYFKSNGKNTPVGFAPDPMSLPYFEGDYIPGEIEKIISQMSKEETRLPVAESSQQKAAIKRAGSKLGTRSNPGNLMNHFQDKVMLRLGNAIYNMKENFIIVRLRNKRFVAAVDRGDDVSGWPDDDEFEPPGKDSSVLNRNTNFDSNTDSDEDFEEREKEERNGKDKGLENKERSECAVFAMKLVEVSCSFKKIGNTVDADTQFESELFENRQLFLNYCQTNHCQFDELRRAKHSTMMVLYQLHNPKAPKFVSQCGSCFRNITNGTRYHCNNCANFDLCHECYRPVTSGHWANRGSRFTHNSEHKFSPIIVENSLASQQQQAEQTKNLQGYLKILNHAAFCSGPPACKLNNCIKMKNHIAHVKTCEITHEKGCKICTRLLTLIIVHARSCNTRSTCPLPFCDRIRERNERLRWQQRLMDDRRRNAQNEFYRSSRE